jgi:hypothetical protein
VSRLRTLTNMLLDVRQRTNQENSTFVTDAELTEYLNQAIAELQVRLAITDGQPHFRSSTTIAVTQPTALYSLPAGFWALQEITATVNGQTMSMLPFMAHERAHLITQSPAWPVYTHVQYRIQAGNIEFRPATESFTAELFYHPAQTRLSAGSDTWDGFNGYEMAPIYDVCATVCSKEETDPSFFLAQRDRLYALIAQAAAHRDMSNPERVTDVTLRDPLWGLL